MLLGHKIDDSPQALGRELLPVPSVTTLGVHQEQGLCLLVSSEAPGHGTPDSHQPLPAQVSRSPSGRELRSLHKEVLAWRTRVCVRFLKRVESSCLYLLVHFREFGHGSSVSSCLRVGVPITWEMFKF